MPNSRMQTRASTEARRSRTLKILVPRYEHGKNILNQDFDNEQISVTSQKKEDLADGLTASHLGRLTSS